MVELQRRDPSRNMARFYFLSIEPNLFGDHELVRRWGRIGTYGREKRDEYENLEGALDGLFRLVAVKVRRGYRAA